MKHIVPTGRPLDGLGAVSFFDGLVFFAPVALLLRTSAGMTVSQFFLLQAAISCTVLAGAVLRRGGRAFGAGGPGGPARAGTRRIKRGGFVYIVRKIFPAAILFVQKIKLLQLRVEDFAAFGPNMKKLQTIFLIFHSETGQAVL